MKYIYIGRIFLFSFIYLIDLRVCFARIRKKFEDIGFDGSVISAYSGVGYILRDLRDEDEDSFQS